MYSGSIKDPMFCTTLAVLDDIISTRYCFGVHNKKESICELEKRLSNQVKYMNCPVNFVCIAYSSLYFDELEKNIISCEVARRLSDIYVFNKFVYSCVFDMKQNIHLIKVYELDNHSPITVIQIFGRCNNFLMLTGDEITPYNVHMMNTRFRMRPANININITSMYDEVQQKILSKWEVNNSVDQTNPLGNSMFIILSRNVLDNRILKEIVSIKNKTNLEDPGISLSSLLDSFFKILSYNMISHFFEPQIEMIKECWSNQDIVSIGSENRLLLHYSYQPTSDYSIKELIRDIKLYAEFVINVKNLFYSNLSDSSFEHLIDMCNGRKKKERLMLDMKDWLLGDISVHIKYGRILGPMFVVNGYNTQLNIGLYNRTMALLGVISNNLLTTKESEHHHHILQRLYCKCEKGSSIWLKDRDWIQYYNKIPRRKNKTRQFTRLVIYMIRHWLHNPNFANEILNHDYKDISKLHKSLFLYFLYYQMIYVYRDLSILCETDSIVKGFLNQFTVAFMNHNISIKDYPEQLLMKNINTHLSAFGINNEYERTDPIWFFLRKWKELLTEPHLKIEISSRDPSKLTRITNYTKTIELIRLSIEFDDAIAHRRV